MAARARTASAWCTRADADTAQNEKNSSGERPARFVSGFGAASGCWKSMMWALWHERHQEDALHAWLRGALVAAARR
jgi:hypothetical protein